MAVLSGYEVVMPKLGLIMTQATLVAWNKADGEWVEKGEVLFTLESEKTTLEIEAPTSGYVQLLVSAGEVVPVQTPIAMISKEKKVAGTPASQPDPAVVMPKTAAREAGLRQDRNVPETAKGLRATPRARRVARENGISLEGIAGSGPRGMVVVGDVLSMAGQRKPVAASPLARKLAQEAGLDLGMISGTGPRGQVTRADIEKALAERKPAAGSAVEPVPVSHPEPLSGLRAVIATRLAESWRERPQVTLMAEVDATGLVKARNRLIEAKGAKVSYNAFFIAALGRALQQNPMLNASLTAEGVVMHSEINIGIAVDTERGLVVPVVRQVDRKDLLVIDRELRELAERALAGKSLPDELGGGTFTLTNLGAYGVDAFTPVINPPEAAILGVGRILPRPVAVEGLLGVRDTVFVSLSFDHRLVDGAPAAKFLQQVVEWIETKAEMLLPLDGR